MASRSSRGRRARNALASLLLLAAPALVHCDKPDETVKLTGKDLCARYRAGRSTAFARHKNDLLVVSSTTWGVAPTPPYRIGINCLDDTGSILAEIDKAAAEAAGIDKKNTAVKVACRWRNQDLSSVDISLTECKVAK